MALTWTMTLKDAMSGAASKAARAVDKLTTSLRGADKASSKSGNANPYAGVAASAQRAGRAVDQLNAKMAKSKSGGMLGTGKGGKMEGLGSGLVGSGAAAGVVGGVAAGWLGGAAGLFELGSMVSDAQAFSKNTSFAFEQILGTKEAAQAAMAMTAKTANNVGADLRTSMGAMNSLLAQGFKADFADEVIRAMADLKTINPQANLEGITRAISQIKTTGRLQGDELMQLAEAGVNVSKVYEQIAKAKGLSDKAGGKTAAQQVQDLQAAGKISSDEAIAAIMGTIKTQVGGKEFGATAAAKMNGTLTGALIKANNLKETFLSSINVDWSPATRALDRVMAVMSGPAGAKFAKALGDGLSRVIGLLDSLTEKDIEAYLNFASAAVEGFSKAIVKAVGAVKWLVDKFVALDNWSNKTFNMSIFDLIAGPILRIGDAITFVREQLAAADIGGALSGMFASAQAAIAGVGESALGIGSAIIDGIVSGISGGAGAIADAAMTAAKGALDSAKSFLGIKSPSKLFRDEVGGQVARGMALGIEGGTPQVRDSSQRMGEQAFNGGQRLSSAITNNTSSSRNNTANLYQQGGDDAEAANTIAIRALADQLRGMNAAGA